MITKLHDLRRRLARLKHRRQRFRWATGYSAVLIALGWALAAVLLLDWWFEMNVPQRVVALGLCGIAAVWTFVRYTRPWLGQHESEIEMALLVERHEHIDSDLVAALEFESPEAPAWGSTQLEQAVIEQVAVSGRRLDVMRSLPRDVLAYRLRLLLATLAVWLAVGVLFPQHLATFAQRLLLSSRHYPTRTQIDAIAVVTPLDAERNRREDVDPDKPDASRVRVLYGKPVQFEVVCSGDLPELAKATVTGAKSGLRAVVDLTPVSDDVRARSPDRARGATEGLSDAQEGDLRSSGRRGQETTTQQTQGGASETLTLQRTYKGELPKLLEDARFQVFAGDAWTDAGRLAMTQLPAIEVELKVVPPEYAKTDKEPPAPRGSRYAAAAEGSQVLVSLRSDKRLKNAELVLRTIELGGSEKANGKGTKHDLHREDAASGDDPAGPDARECWALDPAGTPLAAVTQPLAYAVQVTDVDGQQLERPIEGAVRIQADQPPRVAAGIVTSNVLPKATPTIELGASDDHALARIWIEHEITRGDGKTEQGQKEVYQLSPGQPPKKIVQETFTFDLAPLRLVKGDTVRVTVWAADYRGGREGKTASAEPLTFHVTDEQGIKIGMLETDKQTARELKSIIQRQLGIGE